MKKIAYILIGLLFLVSLPASAQEPEGFSLAISPLINNIEVEPGGVRSGFVEVYNNSSRDVEVIASTVDFEDGGEGHVNIIDNSKTQKPAETLLSNWIQVNPEPLLIPAGKGRSVPFRIEVPETAEPGGKYGAILTSTKPVEDYEDTYLALSASVGSLFLVSVTGDIVEDAVLKEFTAEELYYRNDRIEFGFTIENRGNVHIRPRGEIRIYNQDRKVDTIPINKVTRFGNILPDSERSWSFTWKDKNDIMEAGRYKAVLFLEYGEDRDTITRDLDFWLLPVGKNSAVAILLSFSAFLLLVVFRVFEIYILRSSNENS